MRPLANAARRTPAVGASAAAGGSQSSPAVAHPLPADPRRVLTRQQTQAVYDRAAARVRDSESVYGGPAISALLAAADLRANCKGLLFEFGCGSGRLARRLLQEGELGPGARYLGVDGSAASVELARRRLEVRCCLLFGVHLAPLGRRGRSRPSPASLLPLLVMQ
jgi:SAM-dependent methyltransferase